ncbi:MAG: LPS export ABC transporter permease LptF [Nevskia sp.]|nr:LPS export ABC transporter permease LptF [Nevskia sp.]
MRGSILSRYLMREAAEAWIAVTVVLLAIMIGTRFASVLGIAAKGELPRDLLVDVAMLSTVRYLVILIPASLLLAIMLSLGRLYADSEIAAMTGCGVGFGRLCRPFLWLAAMLAVVTGALAFSFGPWAGRQADYLLKDAKRLVQYTPFEAGQFRTVAGGRAVFYTDSMSPAGDRFGRVFAQIDEARGASVVVADHGQQSIDPASGDRAVQLFDGYRYYGLPGAADYDVMQFHQLTLRLSPPPFAYINNQRVLSPTLALAGSADPQDQAELQARLAAPLSVLILALLAVPLSHLRPREGRYGKLVIGILAYLAYINLISFGQTWIAKGRIPPAIGLWWVHGLVLLVAVWLIARRQAMVR